MLTDQNRIVNMLVSISKIRQLIQDKQEAEFLQSWELQDLCCFHLSLIGEDAKRLSEEIKSTCPEIPWRSVAAMRNVIVHDYGQIDYRLIWQNLSADLEKLETALNSMKREERDQTDTK